MSTTSSVYEEQIMAILREQKAGAATTVPQARDLEGPVLQVESLVWRSGGLRHQPTEGARARRMGRRMPVFEAMRSLQARDDLLRGARSWMRPEIQELLARAV